MNKLKTAVCRLSSQRILFSFLILSALYSNSFAGVAPHNAVTPSVRGVLYVKFKASARHMPSATLGEQIMIESLGSSRYERTLRQLGATKLVPFDPAVPQNQVTHDCGIDRMFVLHYANDVAPIDALQLLLASGEIESGSPRYLFPVEKTPNDPMLAQQYAVTNMRLKSAWDVTTGDTNILIADVDEGTNYNHEDLAANVKLVPGGHGYDIIGSGTASNPQPDADPIPAGNQFSHGTLTAGCIAAVGNNGLGIAGSGYGCKLLAIRADDGTGNIAGGYEGIHTAVTHGARVVSCSWGGPIDPTAMPFLNSLVSEATGYNALIVAASGNDGVNIDSNSFAPAIVPGVLAVGATDENDQPSRFSATTGTNYGNRVNVYAPGTAVLTTDWPGNSAYSSPSGTSFACPLVAGVVGLLMTAHPTWPVKFISQQIINTCDNVVRPSDRFHFWGRVNAGAALATPTLPGLLISSFTVNGKANGLIDTAGTSSTLAVTFKNYIGNGQNIAVTVLTPGGVSIDNPSQQIGALNTGDSRQLTFTLRRNTQFSTGPLPLAFALHDGGTYKDTLILNVLLKTQTGFYVVDSTNFGTGVKQATPGIAWTSHGYDFGGQSHYSWFEFESDFAWNQGGPVNDTTEAAWCVDALDDLTAWFGTASLTNAHPARVCMTDDEGGSWTVVNVSGITSYVNSIHFSTPTSGMFIGDPKGNNWGIGISSDGGKSWHAASSTVAALGGEVGWRNSICWVRRNAWFGTNKGEIYRSSDGGLHFSGVQISESNCVGVGFDDDSLHGLAVCRPMTKTLTGTATGKSALLRSVDGGKSWAAISAPVGLEGLTPNDVKFVPGQHVAYLTSNGGMFKTTDFGTTWSAVGIPTTWGGSDGYLSIAADSKQFVATAVSLYGVISYTEPVKPQVGVRRDPSAPASPVLLQNMPNPATGKTTISFEQATREHVTLSLYDALGRSLGVLLDAVEEPGSHSVALNAGPLASGVYEYVLETESGARLARRMTVVK